MDDNPSLTKTALESQTQFCGVCFMIGTFRGLWVAAEGSIYQAFGNNAELFAVDEPKWAICKA